MRICVPVLPIPHALNVMPRTLDETVDWDPEEETVFVKNRRFAEVIGRSRSWVCKAAKEDYLVDGMPLARWKVEDRYGRTRGFDVPESIWDGLMRSHRYNR